MRKLLLIIISFIMVFLNFSSGKAEVSKQDKRFSLMLNLGKTVAVDELDAASGRGKINFNAGLEYCIIQSRLSYSLGFKIGKFSLEEGTTLVAVDPGGLMYVPFTGDWNWTRGIIYLKLEISNDVLSPYITAGLGLYHLDMKSPDHSEYPDVNKSYTGFNAGLGLELSFKRWPVNIFAGLEHNLVSSVALSEYHVFSPAIILYPHIGLGFSF